MNLKVRARLRREQVKCSESEEDRKRRLAQQAKYARSRRMKLYAGDDKHLKEEQSESGMMPSVIEILEPIIEMSTTI